MKKIIAALIACAGVAAAAPQKYLDVDVNWQQMQELEDLHIQQGASMELRVRPKVENKWLTLTGLTGRWEAREQMTNTSAYTASSVLTSNEAHFIQIDLSSTQTGTSYTNWWYSIILVDGSDNYPIGRGRVHVWPSDFAGASSVLATSGYQTNGASVTPVAVLNFGAGFAPTHDTTDNSNRLTVAISESDPIFKAATNAVLASSFVTAGTVTAFRVIATDMDTTTLDAQGTVAAAQVTAANMTVTEGGLNSPQINGGNVEAMTLTVTNTAYFNAITISNAELMKDGTNIMEEMAGKLATESDPLGLLSDGTRAMGGDLDANAMFTITNLGPQIITENATDSDGGFLDLSTGRFAEDTLSFIDLDAGQWSVSGDVMIDTVMGFIGDDAATGNSYKWAAAQLWHNNKVAMSFTNGAVIAPSFSGDGAGLTNLNATQLTSGTVPLARLFDLSTNQMAAATVAQIHAAGGGGSASYSNTFIMARNPNTYEVAASTWANNWITEDTDPGGNFASSVYTVPTDGWYL